MTARELALSQPDLAPVAVEMPEWGTTVYVHPFDGHGFRRLFEAAKGGEPDPLTLVVLGARDADGVPLFTAEDVPALSRKPLMPFLRIAAAVVELNRLADGVAEAKKG